MTPDPSPVRLLLVDDSEDDYVLTRLALEQIEGQRYELDWAATYDVALATIGRNAHDLYLVDYTLDGRTVLDLLCEAMARNCQAPIIMLTGRSDYQLDLAAMEAGAADYLVKGQLEPRLLERAIRYAIMRRRAEAALRQAQEQLEETVRTRDEFLASASHDLKGPITTIRGVAQLLQRQVQATRRVDAAHVVQELGRVEAATTKMTVLINQLLDLAHLEADRSLTLEPHPTDLVALARRVAAEHQAQSGQHRLHVQSEAPTLVGHWDAFRLERVLDNLLSNAVKYSPAGGEVVLTVAREAGEAGGWAVLVVRDQGFGIPVDDLPRIFERFQRAGNVGSIRGSGIGLAGSRQIVEQHGGTMTVVSQPGAGAAFTVRLPLAKTPDRSSSGAQFR
jgi:signal transduction histidine kinase